MCDSEDDFHVKHPLGHTTMDRLYYAQINAQRVATSIAKNIRKATQLALLTTQAIGLAIDKQGVLWDVGQST